MGSIHLGSFEQPMDRRQALALIAGVSVATAGAVALARSGDLAGLGGVGSQTRSVAPMGLRPMLLDIPWRADAQPVLARHSLGLRSFGGDR